MRAFDGVSFVLSFLIVSLRWILMTRRLLRGLIVKTDPSNREQIVKVLQLRANVEGLRLGTGVLDRFASAGESASLRYALL